MPRRQQTRTRLRSRTAMGAGVCAAVLGMMPAGAALPPAPTATNTVGGQAQKQTPAMQAPIPQAQLPQKQVPQKQNVGCVGPAGAAGQKQSPQGASGQLKVQPPACVPDAGAPVPRPGK